MKFLIVVHYFYPHIGGMEDVVGKQARSLVAKGHSVTVLTCQPQKNLKKIEHLNGYTIYRIPSLNSIENKFGVTFPLVSPFNIIKIFRMLKKFDVIHIHDVFYITSHLTALSAIILRKTYYLTQHVALVEHPSKLVMLIQKCIYNSIGKFILRRAKKVVCYNTNVEKFLHSLGIKKRKILTTRNGVDLDHYSPVDNKERQKLKALYGFNSSKPLVLFIGRLVPKKGYDIVYNAKSDNYITIIAGTGAVPDKMKNDKNVIFFGPATGDQVKHLYQMSDIFVFPAIGEVFTLVLQEAMACGIPIITTNDPAYYLADIDKELLSLVNRNSSELKTSINRILNEKSLANRMAKYSRSLAERDFSWDVNYENEYSIYEIKRVA